MICFPYGARQNLFYVYVKVRANESILYTARETSQIIRGKNSQITAALKKGATKIINIEMTLSIAAMNG
jgi:predicted aspartyl protease